MKSRIEEVALAERDAWMAKGYTSRNVRMKFAHAVATRVLKEFVADFERKSIGLSYSAALYSTKARWGIEP